MAIYRSDQAQFTFAAEGIAGGAPERLDAGTVYAGSTLSAAAVKGSRTIAVAATTNINATTGQFIVISGAEPLGAVSEVKRVIGIDTLVLTLDSPLAFDHPTGATVTAVNHATGNSPDSILSAHSAGSNSAESSAYITWIPGIYDTVDAPDPVEAMEPRYMLGQNTVRNAYQMVKGQQTLTGSVAGITLINGWPLRFPLGSVQTVLTTTGRTTMANARLTIKKGEVFANIAAVGGATTNAQHSDNSWIIMGDTENPTSSTNCEIRKIIKGHGINISNGASAYVRLNAPAQFDHTTQVVHFATDANVMPPAGTARFHHHIFDSVELDSVTWNLNVKDENGANTFQRRYTGGKIGSMTLTAEEGGLVTCDWDTATFMNFNHNQQRSARDGTTATDFIRRYLPMIDIGKTDVGVPEIASSLPTTNPYYFSEGSVKFFGNDVARVRTFSLTISNGEEARYYIRNTKDDSRSPFEIKEGNREYSMSATIALPDATSGAEVGTSIAATAHSIWKELIMAGTGGAGDAGDAGNNFSGFDIELKFQRDGSATDQITIRIPGAYDGSTANAKAGGLNQGALINSAPISIDGSNPMEQTVDIVFRDLKIEIKDGEALYP